MAKHKLFIYMAVGMILSAVLSGIMGVIMFQLTFISTILLVFYQDYIKKSNNG